jgi:hypothetical protein
MYFLHTKKSRAMPARAPIQPPIILPVESVFLLDEEAEDPVDEVDSFDDIN